MTAYTYMAEFKEAYTGDTQLSNKPWLKRFSRKVKVQRDDNQGKEFYNDDSCNMVY